MRAPDSIASQKYHTAACCLFPHSLPPQGVLRRIQSPSVVVYSLSRKLTAQKDSKLIEWQKTSRSYKSSGTGKNCGLPLCNLGQMVGQVQCKTFNPYLFPHRGNPPLLQINSFCQGIGSLSKSEFLLSFFSISVSPGSEIAFWVVTHYEEPRNEIVCPWRDARQVLK